MNLVPLPIRLHRAGIVYPNWTARASKISGCPLGTLCAVLMLESSGGLNVYGHDPGPFSGAGLVTQANYKAYAAVRDKTGECQGVGPMQLTSKSLQVEADAAGGCWEPEHNIGVGAHFLEGCLKAHPGNLAAGCAAYNGSGPAAEQYGARAAALAEHFAQVLS
jgi:Transglycosylase SLT domain